jgi:hypothetical protein
MTAIISTRIHCLFSVIVFIIVGKHSAAFRSHINGPDSMERLYVLPRPCLVI